MLSLQLPSYTEMPHMLHKWRVVTTHKPVGSAKKISAQQLGKGSSRVITTA
jgi:hypothetical protein